MPPRLCILELLLLLAPVRLPAQAIGTDAPPADLSSAAREHYEAYGNALSRGLRSEIAHFYATANVLRIFNGIPSYQTRSSLDARYRSSWQPPAYFAWDSLTFTPYPPSLVLVTGGFRWQSAGQPDTARFQYTALLAAIDSGLAITFEQETLWPPRR